MPRNFQPMTMIQFMGHVEDILMLDLHRIGYKGVEIDIQTRNDDRNQRFLVVRAGTHHHYQLNLHEAKAALNQGSSWQAVNRKLAFWPRFEEVCDRILTAGYGQLMINLEPIGPERFALQLHGLPSYRFNFKVTAADLQRSTL